jgi:2-C-methyl-D-erythritol 2,4-cyclodiphosphate synthase
MNQRIGIGYDVHRFAENRKCLIGGVEFEHAKGLLGHSDADVLLHAVCDALLGAAGLGDIGLLFPDTHPEWKDADSKKLLQICYQRVCEKGFRLNNLDAVVVCDEPKIGPRREEIKKSIASILELEPELISVKGKTEEGLGGDCVKAWVVVLLKKILNSKFKIQNDPEEN